MDLNQMRESYPLLYSCLGVNRKSADGYSPMTGPPEGPLGRGLTGPATSAVPICMPELLLVLDQVKRARYYDRREGRDVRMSRPGGSATHPPKPSRDAGALDDARVDTILAETMEFNRRVVDGCAKEYTFRRLRETPISISSPNPQHSCLPDDISPQYSERVYLRPVEVYYLATICPRDYSEAIQQCPSLAVYDSSEIAEMIMEINSGDIN
eukprot:Tbor_TRINITY_DN5924_c2_g1::TRINITY_DN5924_c2_g1_i1::g.18917::m.18917